MFAEVHRALDAQGLMLKSGTLIDATPVEASVRRPSASEDEVSFQASDTGLTRRGSKSGSGFKSRVAVDQGSALVRRVVLTSADLHESLIADALFQGDERAVFAAEAYDGLRRRRALAEAGSSTAPYRPRLEAARSDQAGNRRLVSYTDDRCMERPCLSMCRPTPSA